jgi:hypothetical protein
MQTALEAMLQPVDKDARLLSKKIERISKQLPAAEAAVAKATASVNAAKLVFDRASRIKHDMIAAHHAETTGHVVLEQLGAVATPPVARHNTDRSGSVGSTASGVSGVSGTTSDDGGSSDCDATPMLAAAQRAGVARSDASDAGKSTDASVEADTAGSAVRGKGGSKTRLKEQDKASRVKVNRAAVKALSERLSSMDVRIQRAHTELRK